MILYRFCPALSKVRVCTSSVSAKLFPLPWWTHVIGYLLAYATVACCTYLIVILGGGLGEYLATQWLIAMLVCIFKSIIIIQPVKVRLIES